VTNYSWDVRYFQEYDYVNLPTSFEAPLDDEYDAMTSDEYYAIEAIIEIYFLDEYFTDKEQALLTQPQLERMREIFAEIFEDEIVYGWYATDALLLTELQETDPEDRYWYRSDLEYYLQYGSFELANAIDGDIYLDDDIIAILDPSVETRLDEFREILANVNEFEQDYLQTLLDAIALFDATSEEDFFYTDEDDNSQWLDLYDLNVGALIEAGLGDDILAVFAAYEALTEIEQMLLTEYYYWNYDELYYGYYEYFITVYENALDEIYTIEDNNYYDLFDKLAEIEALLADIDNLNEISFDLFTTFDEDGEYYWYESYEYWIYLSELLPYLQEAKPVFDDWIVIEAALKYDEFEAIVLDSESALAILAMYKDYSDLSEDAQYTLDDERINDLYELALSFLVNVAKQLIEALPLVEELTLDDESDVELARRAYNLLTEDQQEALGEDYLLRLEAAEARIEALKQTAWGDILTTFGVLLLHLAAAAYFVFLKRKDLAKLTGLQILAK
jgi:hypothetical protein